MKYEKKFTPGPWQIDEDGDVSKYVSEFEGDIIFDYISGVQPCKEREHNAHLIAAAPELLDALIECVHFLDGCLLDPMCKKEAKAVINKALNIKNDTNAD